MRLILSLLAPILGLLVTPALAQAPQTAPAQSEILVGMSAPFSGPTAHLGEAMRDGLEAAFDEANRAGGVKGRALKLKWLDDGYEPDRAAANVRALIDEHKVLLLAGCVGTPTAVAAIPIAVAKKTLFYGAFTGAGVLRKTPPDRYVINFRASYAQETGEMVDALVRHAGLKPEEIAFFTQRDAYGDAGYSGGMAALKRHGLKNESAVAHGRYERNTDAIENGLADLLGAPLPPRAVIMVGAYKPCAKFIRLARQTGLDSIILNVSFVGPMALMAEAGPEGEGVIITQVVPSPDADVPLCVRHREALANAKPGCKPLYGSLEGYAAGRVLILALSKMDDPTSRESIINALNALGRFDIGLGLPLTLAADDTQACDAVWPTVIRAGRIVPFDWAELAKGRTVTGVDR